MKDYKKSILALRIFSDMVATLVAWFLAFYLRFYVLPGSNEKPFSLFAILAVLACVLTLFFCNKESLYDCKVLSTFAQESANILRVSVYVFLAFVCVYYYLFPSRVSRLALLLFFCFHFVFMFVGRRAINALYEAKY